MIEKSALIYERKIDATNEDGLLEQIRDLLHVLRPNWERDSIKLKAYSNGITNKVIRVESANDDEMLIFRIFGPGTESIIDRKSEMESFHLLSKHGIAPPVYARFPNGFVCGFLSGHPLDSFSVRTAKIVPHICKKVAELHRVEVPIPEVPFLFSKAEQFLSNIPQNYTSADTQRVFDSYFGEFNLKEDFNRIRRLLADVKQNRQVLCHNDLLVYNILFDDEKDEANIIDYEYTGVNYQLFDIANHFCEYAGVENVNYDLCPNEEEKYFFIKSYLIHYLGREPSGIEVEEMVSEVPKFEAAAHLFWALWALVQAEISNIDFDYVSYAAKRHNQFVRISREFPEDEESE